MKLNEFKAWFEGYTESMDSTPSEKQWKRIKEQVKEIDGTAITNTVYLDRYWRPYWGGYPYTAYASAGLASVGNLSGAISQNAQNLTAMEREFDGVSAMYAAGKAEALAA